MRIIGTLLGAVFCMSSLYAQNFFEPDYSFQCRLENSGGNQAVYLGYEHHHTFRNLEDAAERINTLVESERCELREDLLPECFLSSGPRIFTVYLVDEMESHGDQDFYHAYASQEEADARIDALRNYGLCR